MSYVVLIEKRVEFETEHLGEAIAFKIGRQAGVLAKLLGSPGIEPPTRVPRKRKKPRKKSG